MRGMIFASVALMTLGASVATAAAQGGSGPPTSGAMATEGNTAGSNTGGGMGSGAAGGSGVGPGVSAPMSGGVSPSNPPGTPPSATTSGNAGVPAIK